MSFHLVQWLIHWYTVCTSIGRHWHTQCWNCRNKVSSSINLKFVHTLISIGLEDLLPVMFTFYRECYCTSQVCRTWLLTMMGLNTSILALWFFIVVFGMISGCWVELSTALQLYTAPNTVVVHVTFRFSPLQNNKLLCYHQVRAEL